MSDSELAGNLKSLRQELGLTLQDIADLCGIRGGRASVSKWERESEPQRPEDRLLLLLADFYGVSLDYLYGRPHARRDSPAVAAARASLRARVNEEPAGLTTPGQRLALVWNWLSELAPGVFHPQRVAAELNLSPDGFAELARGHAQPAPGVVTRFAAICGLPEGWFYTGR